MPLAPELLSPSAGCFLLLASQYLWAENGNGDSGEGALALPSRMGTTAKPVGGTGWGAGGAPRKHRPSLQHS